MKLFPLLQAACFLGGLLSGAGVMFVLSMANIKKQTMSLRMVSYHAIKLGCIYGTFFSLLPTAMAWITLRSMPIATIFVALAIVVFDVVVLKIWLKKRVKAQSVVDGAEWITKQSLRDKK